MRGRIILFWVLLICNPLGAQLLYNNLSPLTWQLGYSSDEKETPKSWIPATVPGAVQLDISKSFGWGPFYYAENWKDYLPFENNYYTYRSQFARPILKKEEHVFFVSLGIDYEFNIFLNGELLLHQEGMFTPVKIDITSKLKDSNKLEVVVFPAPKSHAAPADRSQADHSVKPAQSYGWDWHPRLIPLGIWDETGLSVESVSYLSEFSNHYELNASLDQAILNVELKGRNAFNTAKYVWNLLDEAGNIVSTKQGNFDSDASVFSTVLINPELWWPHDQGNTHLYNSIVYLEDKNGNSSANN